MARPDTGSVAEKLDGAGQDPGHNARKGVQMNDASSPVSIVAVSRRLFAEAYEGTDGPTWFVNNGAEGGLLATIEPLTAAEASRSITPESPSIAAHVEHLRWSLANVNSVARGGEWNPDWSASWSVRTVTEDEWRALKAGLHREFAGVLEALASQDLDESDGDIVMGIAALAPHAAHHLGAIRQVARIVRAGGGAR